LTTKIPREFTEADINARESCASYFSQPANNELSNKHTRLRDFLVFDVQKLLSNRSRHFHALIPWTKILK